jgi:hypothetical protein
VFHVDSTWVLSLAVTCDNDILISDGMACEQAADPAAAIALFVDELLPQDGRVGVADYPGVLQHVVQLHSLLWVLH